MKGNGFASPKFRGGQNFIGLSTGAPRIRQRGPLLGVWGRSPSRKRLRGHGFLGFLQEKHSLKRSFLSKKDTRVAPSGLNATLLALLVDLRRSISIFVFRLVVTENISGGWGYDFGGLATPLMRGMHPPTSHFQKCF